MEKTEDFIKNTAELPSISGEEFNYIRKSAKLYLREVALMINRHRTTIGKYQNLEIMPPDCVRFLIIRIGINNFNAYREKFKVFKGYNIICK